MRKAQRTVGQAERKAAGDEPAISSGLQYRKLSLVELADRIARYDDRAALDELHRARTVFSHCGGRRLRLAEFLERLRIACGEAGCLSDDPNVCEQAYDLTLDKFSNLPERHQRAQASSAARRRPAGPDCRVYFASFARHAAQRLKARPVGLIESDAIAGRLLQRFVYRHFRLSLAEAKRRSVRHARRFIWHGPAGAICLWMPRELTGPKCRRWLDEHAAESAKTEADAQARVQALVDDHFGYRALQRLWDSSNKSREAPVPAVETGRSRLADVVAREKCQRIDQQRDAIAALGPARLAELIHRVFEGLEAGEFRASMIAREFGLTKATFSRFAGAVWPHAGDTNTRVVPDLWRNTAEVVAVRDDFAAAAEHAGVWPAIEQVRSSK